MRWLFLILLCATSAPAQIQGNRPDLLRSCVDSGHAGTCKFPDGFATGNLIVAFGHANDKLLGVAPTVDDDSGVGNTYTCDTPTDTPTPADPSKGGATFICYAVAAGNSSSANVTAHFTNTDGGRLAVGIFSGLSGTPDGSVTAGTGSGGDGTITSTNITTTKSGDIVMCNISKAFFDSMSMVTSSSNQMETVAEIGANTDFQSHMIHADTVGTYGCSYTALAHTADNSTWAVQAIAFPPSSAAITDTVMPQAGVGTAYSAQLHAVGGTAGFTCSITVGSLPTGLSLGGTGNCTISGTPSGGAGTSSFTAHVDDGAGHTANASLSITVVASLVVPLLRTSLAAFVGSGQGSVSVPNVQCGDVVSITSFGNTYTDSDGFVNSLTGTQNFWKGSLGETYYRVPNIGGTKNAPATTFVSTPLVTSGITSDTISFSTSDPANNHSGIMVFITVWAGVQQVVDPGPTVYAGYGDGTRTITNSMTTLVPNSIVFAYWGASNDDLTNFSSLGISSPFTSITSNTTFSQAAGISGYVLQSTVGSVSATVTSTGGDSGNLATTRNLGLMAFRAAGLPNCGAFAGLGEKIRRISW